MTAASPPPARKRLVLMWHGAVSYFGADGRLIDPRSVALTANGEAQAAAAAGLLAGYRFDRVAVSSAPRTQDTAALVLGARGGPSGGPLHILHDLREIRGGRFSDVPTADIDRTIGCAFDGAARDRHLQRLVDLHAGGAVKPHISAVYPLAEAARAIQDLQDRRVTGKVVVEVA